MEIIVKRRLKKFSSNRWWGFSTPNGDNLKDHIWSDEIGSQTSNFYKSHTTSRYESRYGSKYSPNRKTTYHRDKKPKRESLGTREKDRVLLFKILKENGLK